MDNNAKIAALKDMVLTYLTDNGTSIRSWCSMKTLLIVLLGLSLAACEDTENTDPLAMAKQDYACKDDGGAYQYTWLPFVTCRSGVDKEWGSVVLTEEYYPAKPIMTIKTKGE
jgi:hypothetical protein